MPSLRRQGKSRSIQAVAGSGRLSQLRWRYALAGSALGLGSPAGLLALRFLGALPAAPAAWLLQEVPALLSIYLYTGIGTVLAFGVFGYFLGRQADALKRNSDRLHLTASYLEQLSITDGLTHLYVHNYMLQRLREEWARARRYGFPLSCLFIDIDGFKSLNDRHGHLFGDRVLSCIAEILLRQMRDSDLVGRFGGDEFLAILPNIGSERACFVAERIRQAVGSMGLESDGNPVPVTVSIGAYAASRLPATPEAVLESADRAMQRAKREGKNRFVIFTEPDDLRRAPAAAELN